MIHRRISSYTNIFGLAKLFLPYIVSGIKDVLMSAKVGDATIWEECVAKLLGILIDSDLTFNDHVKMICKKASQKLSAISRMADIISIEKRKTLLSAFFESQFSYCPLIWMFCSRKLNTRINRIHERVLRNIQKRETVMRNFP